MKKLLLTCAFLAPVLLSLHAPGSRIRFAPAEKSSSTKTFENKAEFTLDHLAMTVNGQESPMMPDMEMTLSSSQKVVVTDEYVSLREGAPKVLKRRFDELGNDVAISTKIEMMGQTQSNDHSMKGESVLQGKTVVFTWNEEKGEYVKAFDPAEEKSDLLDDLREDMDLRVFLPAGEVKEGEEWDIDVKTLGSVLAPGGNLAILPKEMDADQMGMGGMPGMGSMSDWLGELLEGTAKGTFAGTREVDGASLAVIKLVIKVSTSKDLTEMVREAMKNAKLPPEAGDLEFERMDLDLKMEAEGELLWDLAGNRAHSFEMSGPSHVNMDMAMKIEAQGQSMNLEQSMELSGTSTLSVRFE